MSDTIWPKGWKAQKLDHELWLARTTTPEQRGLWLWDMMQALEPMIRALREREKQDDLERWNRS